MRATADTVWGHNEYGSMGETRAKGRPQVDGDYGLYRTFTIVRIIVLSSSESRI